MWFGVPSGDMKDLFWPWQALWRAAFQPLFSLHKAFCNPYFWGEGALRGTVGWPAMKDMCVFFFASVEDVDVWWHAGGGVYGIVPPTGPEFCYGNFFCDLFNLENSCDLGNLQLADPVKEKKPFWNPWGCLQLKACILAMR